MILQMYFNLIEVYTVPDSVVVFEYIFLIHKCISYCVDDDDYVCGVCV